MVQASISKKGKAAIHATFAKKEDLGTFFKTFANPKVRYLATLLPCYLGTFFKTFANPKVRTNPPPPPLLCNMGGESTVCACAPAKPGRLSRCTRLQSREINPFG